MMERTVVDVDDSRRTTSQRIVDAVAEAEGDPPTHLREPLFRAIDPDALNRPFDRRVGREGVGSPTVQFRFHGFAIRATGARITVSRPGDAEA